MTPEVKEAALRILRDAHRTAEGVIEDAQGEIEIRFDLTEEEVDTLMDEVML